MDNSIEDMFACALRRYFVPCKRVIASGGSVNAEALIGSKVLQNFTWNKYPVCRVEKGGFLVLDFGRELSGGVRIVTGMMEPCKVRLRFGESVAECCMQPNMDHAVHDLTLDLTLLSASEFGNTGFRFVRLDVLEGEFLLNNCIAVANLLDAPKLGSFRSSDELLNKIFDVSAHTVHLCIQDYVLDGVKRDRLLWGGDMHPELLAILAVFGNIPQLEMTMNRLCFDTQDGMFINDHTSYSLWMLIILRDLWFYTGNDALLSEYKEFIVPTVKRYLAMVKADGRIEFEGHVFLDWPSSDDEAGIYAGAFALLVMALKAAQEMFEVIAVDPAEITAALQRLRGAIPEVNNNKSAAALQHLTGWVDRRDVLENDPTAGVTTFIGNYVLFAKENASALDLLKKYWGGMLKMGATSFWEDFDLDWLADDPEKLDEMPSGVRKNIHADFGRYCYKGLRHSFCHGWAAGPAAWLQRKILGVESAERGFGKITFNPDLCGLEYAEGTIPTPHGVIEVKLRKGEAPQIKLPENIVLDD